MRYWPLIVFVLWFAPAPVAADGRVALLIGNGGYRNDDFALANPANDVRALGAALTRLGFEVRSEVDLSRPQMRAALDWLGRSARGADIALVFYAGHSVQAEAENYLIGTELAELSAPALVDSSVTLSEVLTGVEAAGAELSLVILDACRDNPFGGTRIGEAGLSPVSGSIGTLVAYATDPGNVAADGLGANSTFTAALLDHVETPGIDVRIMFGRVRQDVVGDTGGQQVPWVEEAVLGEHYLAAPPDPLDPGDELSVWREAVVAGSVESYRDYLESFPEGLYKIVAQLRIDALQGNAPEATDLDTTDLPAATAALEMIGHLVPNAADVPDTEVRQAFARWQSTRPAGARGFPALMAEAARTATYVGTYTVGILKNDLQRYASVDTALEQARDNLRIAEADFGDDAQAQSALQRMRDDVAQVERIRRNVAADLDASRTYYSDLIALTDRYLADWMSEDAQPRFASSRGITRLSDRALSDARTFTRHLAIARTAPDGSYTWLASMMEGL
ncbi:caspase family protein [Meridianimarinicoccus sp. RP-17]|uniref:caspase family protein n=1 Tax=Meridianimarinicoccus zhengii TaxID=2056810 RepID=UPI0013A6EB6D|nr:caspase family protein [Phycocomes zhengii]